MVGLAAVYAAWDFGRRWLVSHERAKEAALIRTQEMRDEFSHALVKASAFADDRYDDALKAIAELRDKYGDLGTQLNLRVREFGDRLDALPAAEAVDLTKHNKAVENLARQLHELSRVSATQTYVQDQLKATEDRFNATLTGAVAKGARIRA